MCMSMRKFARRRPAPGNCRRRPIASRASGRGFCLKNIPLKRSERRETMAANDNGNEARWTAAQIHTVIASFIAWTLDAFDFFVMVFILGDIAKEFGSSIGAAAWGLTLTLMLRPVGAYIFG